MIQEEKTKPQEAFTPKLEDNGEPLVPASCYPERILVRPQYFIQGLEGSIPECYVREGVLERLIEVAESLPRGWKLVLLDCWRPLALQKALFSKLCREPRERNKDLCEEEIIRRAKMFVALPSDDPIRVPGHATGGAVDLTISDNKGRILYMGSDFDETTERSFTCYYENLAREGKKLSAKEKEAMENRKMLLQLMGRANFSNYPEEWWHFDFGNMNWAIRTGAPKAIYGITKPKFRWVS
jgi:D-alanyl-D-alanine dipeptidase